VKGGWKLPLVLLIIAAALNAVVGCALAKYMDPVPLAPGEFAGSVMLAAMRPVVKSYLWTRADTLIRERKYFEVKPILDRLAEIEPRFVEAYFFNAQVLAFDMQSFAKRADVKWRWISEGFRYAVRGARRNPEDPWLPWLAARILHMQVAANRRHGKEFSRFFLNDREINPGREPVVLVIIRWCEKSRSLPGHDPTVELLLDTVYRGLIADAKSKGLGIVVREYYKRRKTIWTEFTPPADWREDKWRQRKGKKLTEIERALKALPGGRGENR